MILMIMGIMTVNDDEDDVNADAPTHLLPALRLGMDRC